MKQLTILARLSVLGVAVGVGLLTGACGDSASVTGPSAAAGRGASIQGTVETPGSGGGSAASVHAPSASGIRVSVVGTSLATTTGSSGGFTLTDVPTGTATLRFEAPGIDASLQISGLVDGQVLSINVRVSGSQAVLTPRGSDDPSPSPSPTPSPSPSPENEVGLRGRIDSIAAPNLVVSGRTIRTDGATRIQRSGQALSFGDLRVGQSVEVEGRQLADGSILAKKISVEDDDNGADEVRMVGTVESVTPPSLRVAGRMVVTNSATRITSHGDPISLSDIRAGNTVEVEGSVRSDGSLLAKKISLED